MNWCVRRRNVRSAAVVTIRTGCCSPKFEILFCHRLANSGNGQFLVLPLDAAHWLGQGLRARATIVKQRPLTWLLMRAAADQLGSRFFNLPTFGEGVESGFISYYVPAALHHRR